MPAAVCEEDKGDLLGMEEGEGFVGARDGGGGAEEDAVDAGDVSLWRVWCGGEGRCTRMRMRSLGLGVEG